MSDPYDEIPLERRWQVRELVEIAERHGMTVAPRAAYRAWDEYSDESAAGWLLYRDEQEVIDILKNRCKTVYE